MNVQYRIQVAKRWLFGLAFVGGLLGHSAASWAAGFYLPGRGVHSMARGGASIAGGDSLQTLWYNPANLVDLTGFQLLIDVGLIQTQVHYQRAPRIGEDGQKREYQPVDNQASILPDPSILLGYGWKKYNLTLAGGIYAPYAANLKFSDTGAQRYAIADMTGSLFLISHVALGWAPHPRFRIGAGIQNFTVTVRLLAAGSAYLGIFGGPEDRDLDLYSEANLSSPVNISGNVGLWARAVDLPSFKLDVAASVQLPLQVRATGQLKVRLPTHPLFDPTTVDGSAAETTLNLPLILRGAVRAEIMTRFNIELAFVYEGWSSLEEIELKPVDPPGIWVNNVPTIGRYKVPPILIPRDFQDAYSLRLGAGLKLLSWLELQLGYAFETTAIPDATHSVFLVDANKHLVSVGFSFQWKNMIFDVAYAHIFQETRDIQKENCGQTGPNGKVIRCMRQINPLNPDGAIVIGSGKYESSYNIFGISWRATF